MKTFRQEDRPNKINVKSMYVYSTIKNRLKCFACYAAIPKGLYKCIVRNTVRNQQINAHAVKNVVKGQ